MESNYFFSSCIQEICDLHWEALTQDELTAAAWAYYYFSIQFRENLELACMLFPHDEKLGKLLREECDTDNLSPWPGVANPHEKMDHDEFMRRALTLSELPEATRARVTAAGQRYQGTVRRIDTYVRAMSIGSYEDGGLEQVFTAFLGARDWNNPLLDAFRHFLMQHIEFDAEPEQGHGAMSRHLKPDDRILPLWAEFKQLLIESVPSLAGETAPTRATPEFARAFG